MYRKCVGSVPNCSDRVESGRREFVDGQWFESVLRQQHSLRDQSDVPGPSPDVCNTGLTSQLAQISLNCPSNRD